MFLTWYRFCTTASKTKMLNKPEMMKIRADRGRLKRGTILLSRSIRWALTSNKESTGCDVTPHSAGLLLILEFHPMQGFVYQHLESFVPWLGIVGARRSMVLGARDRNATRTRREHMVPEPHITSIALISSFVAHIHFEINYYLRTCI